MKIKTDDVMKRPKRLPIPQPKPPKPAKEAA